MSQSIGKESLDKYQEHTKERTIDLEPMTHEEIENIKTVTDRKIKLAKAGFVVKAVLYLASIAACVLVMDLMLSESKTEVILFNIVLFSFIHFVVFKRLYDHENNRHNNDMLQYYILNKEVKRKIFISELTEFILRNIGLSILIILAVPIMLFIILSVIEYGVHYFNGYYLSSMYFKELDNFAKSMLSAFIISTGIITFFALLLNNQYVRLLKLKVKREGLNNDGTYSNYIEKYFGKHYTRILDDRVKGIITPEAFHDLTKEYLIEKEFIKKMKRDYLIKAEVSYMLEYRKLQNKKKNK